VEVSADPTLLAAAKVIGLRVALFLVEAPRSSGSYLYGDQGSELPGGVTLWAPTNPQGLVIGYRPGTGVIVPMTGEVDPDASVSYVLPVLR